MVENARKLKKSEFRLI